MDYYLRSTLNNCFANFYSCLNCSKNCSGRQVWEPNERTHLLVDSITNSPALRCSNSDSFTNEYSQSLPGKEEQAALNNIVQNTAINIINVAQMDWHKLEPQEYNDRVQLYLQMLPKQWSKMHYSNSPTGLLKDIPNPESFLIAAQISTPDLSLIRRRIKKAHFALEDIKVEHREDIVVPFRIQELTPSPK